MKPVRGALATLVFPFLLVFTCPVQAQKTHEIGIQNYRFQPPDVHIQPGDTVRWVNHEKRTSHSVLFPVEHGGESERFFPDESWQRRFDLPGIYSYRCGPHPEMTGTVVVSTP